MKRSPPTFNRVKTWATDLRKISLKCPKSFTILPPKDNLLDEILACKKRTFDHNVLPGKMSHPHQSRIALPKNHMLGRYQLLSTLGSGAFGITYLAYDTGLDRNVAIKELLPFDIAIRIGGQHAVIPRDQSLDDDFDWARERFLEEGRILATCRHKAIMQIYDTFLCNGTAYLVMPYLKGRTLSEWRSEIQRRPNLSELLVLSRHLLGGLREVHSKNFLHRDIKPDNIYITDDGQSILIDFGAARHAIGMKSRPITSIVTPGYAPLEQYYSEAESGGTQGPWSDLYSFSALLCWCITGEKPAASTERVNSGQASRIASCRDYAKEYGKKFLEVIDKGLETESSKRPQSAEIFYQQLTGKALAC